MLLAASQGVPRTIGAVIAVVLTVAFAVALYSNIRRSRPEIGSEIELAPNRKPYYNDEELEGKRLEANQWLGLGVLVVCAIGLPAYWLAEPGRQEAADSGFDKRFARWGSEIFETTANGGFNCAFCHGGMKAGGASAPTVINDTLTGQVKEVQWYAPALNTVLLRYSEAEVREILVYGRKFSPMPAWGIDGGGAMNDQQIETVIEYLKSISLCDPKVEGICEAANKIVTDDVAKASKSAAEAGKSFDEGAYLFSNVLGSGAYSCARCHTAGWSTGTAEVDGGGALGPSFVGGAATRRFPTEADHEVFIGLGSNRGDKYGVQGQGSGRMPGFAKVLSAEQIKAIVEYERSL
jgi:mono/diheme cytochrome c family protein